jgi:glycosyltransferase involved in cell wall biosynthesis
MEVGVVIPVRSPSPFLGAALDGVLSQVPPPARVVVVDDASDPPIRLDERHAARCVLLRRGEAGGPAAARQTALAELDTELVALCDDDDVWEEGKLAAQLEAMEVSPQAAVCFGRATVVDTDGQPTGERWREPEPGLHDGASFGALLYEHNPVPTSSVVLRRAALDGVGGFAGQREQGEDLELWLRLAARGEAFLCVPAARVRYRRHAAGLTADVAELAAGTMAVHERHAGLVDDAVRRHVRAADLAALARGRVRARDYAAARAALAEAARLEPPAPRERLLRALLAVPGARAALGRRGAYRARS